MSQSCCVVKSQASSCLAWVVVLTSALFFFYEFIQMNLFNAINTQLREAFHLNATQLGQLFSMYFYANTLFLLAAGNLLDRFSTRKLLLSAVIVCTIGTFIFALAKFYWFAALGRFMVGISAAFCFLSCIRLASRWFPPRRMALVTGVVVTMAMLGGLMAQTPFAFLIEYLGDWRQALLVNASIGIVVTLIIYFTVQDRPPHSEKEEKSDQAHLKELGVWRCIKLAALNPQNWLGGLYTSLINLPVFILGGLWGIHYLIEVHGISLVQASYATTVFFVGIMLGSPAFGWLSDKMERRVLPMKIGAVLSLLVMIALMYIPDLSLSMVIILFFLMGFVTSSQVLTYPALAELNPIYLTSTAISIDSICIMVSGFVFPPFFGWLMEHTGTHQVVEGVTIYSPDAYHHAMLIILAAFVVGLMITFFMRETYCRSQVQD